MRFTIKGADRNSAEELELIVDAPDEETACSKAFAKGILVAECVPAEQHSESSSQPAIVTESPGPESRVSGKWIGRIVSIVIASLLVAGVMGSYWQSARQEDRARLGWRLLEINAEANTLVSLAEQEIAAAKGRGDRAYQTELETAIQRFRAAHEQWISRVEDVDQQMQSELISDRKARLERVLDIAEEEWRRQLMSTLREGWMPNRTELHLMRLRAAESELRDVLREMQTTSR